MATTDFYTTLADFAWITPKDVIATWTLPTCEIYSETDWWRSAMKIWCRSVKPRTAKVV